MIKHNKGRNLISRPLLYPIEYLLRAYREFQDLIPEL